MEKSRVLKIFLLFICDHFYSLGFQEHLRYEVTERTAKRFLRSTHTYGACRDNFCGEFHSEHGLDRDCMMYFATGGPKVKNEGCTSACPIGTSCYIPNPPDLATCPDLFKCSENPCLGYPCAQTSDLCHHSGPNQHKCSNCNTGKSDIVFVMDSSVSVGKSLNKSTDFLWGVVNGLEIGNNAYRVALMTYSFDQNVLFPFDRYTSKTVLLNAIPGVSGQSGVTLTAKALLRAEELCRSSSRQDVYKIIVLLSDGLSTDRREAIRFARRYRKSQILFILTVGIGRNIAHTELLNIATETEVPLMFPPNPDDVINTIRKLSMHPSCSKCKRSSRTDVLVLLDTTSRHQLSIDVTMGIALKLNASATETRLGVITFSNVTTYGLNISSISDSVMAFIQSVSVSHAEPHIQSALDYVSSQGFATRRGGRPDSRKLVIIVSSGNWTDLAEVKNKPQALKQQHIQVSAVITGEYSGYEIVKSLLDDPYYAFYVGDSTQTEVLQSFTSLATYTECA